MTLPNLTQPPPALAQFEPDLTRALNLARAARQAAEAGDLARAAALRAEHDAIYARLEKFLIG